MADDQILHIEAGFEPASLIGKRFDHEGAVFELASILRASPEGMVYEARDAQTGRSEHVLKIYLTKLSREELQQKQAAYHQCAEILGDGCPEGEFAQIGEWTVRLQRKALDDASLIAAAPPEERIQGRLDGGESEREIADLFDAGDFAGVVQKCDEALKERALYPTYLHLKGLALFQLGDPRAANKTLRLCFEVEPDNTLYYVAVVEGCAAIGEFIWARKWAQEGIERARDKRQVCRAWFETEMNAERVELVRLCLGRLKLLEEPEPSLEELRLELEGLEERLARCERDLTHAWRLLQQGKLEEATRMSRRLTYQHPHHEPALFLSGVLAMEREQWAEAIGHLCRAFTHQPLCNPDVPLLLGFAYLKLGKVDLAAVMHLVWQERYSEAAAAVPERGRRGSKGEGALLPFEPEPDSRLLKDTAALAQQGEAILRAYQAVSGADSGTRERIAELTRGTTRLLGWLAGSVDEEGAR